MQKGSHWAVHTSIQRHDKNRNISADLLLKLENESSDLFFIPSLKEKVSLAKLSFISDNDYSHESFKHPLEMCITK